MLIRWTRPGDSEAFMQCVSGAGLSTTPAQLAFYLSSGVVGTYVAEVDGRIVGTGCCTAYAGGTGWIGVITVLPEYQRRGLGRALTEWGIQSLRDQGVRTCVLAATAAGRPLYEQLGFESICDYLTMDGTGLLHPPRDVRLRPLFGHDWPAVEALDESATGEQRGALLRAMRTVYVLVSHDGRIAGAHLAADWGGGASVASDPEAGRLMIDLARGLWGEQPMKIFVPEPNTEAVTYLTSLGFTVLKRTRYMVLGPKPAGFNPDRIWGTFSLALG